MTTVIENTGIRTTEFVIPGKIEFTDKWMSEMWGDGMSSTESAELQAYIDAVSSKHNMHTMDGVCNALNEIRSAAGGCGIDFWMVRPGRTEDRDEMQRVLGVELG